MTHQIHQVENTHPDQTEEQPKWHMAKLEGATSMASKKHVIEIKMTTGVNHVCCTLSMRVGVWDITPVGVKFGSAIVIHHCNSGWTPNFSGLDFRS